MKEQDYIYKMNAQDIKDMTINKLLENEETNHLYTEYMDMVCSLASKGITSTDVGIWEFPSYACTDNYDIKQNVVKIFQLKGFEVSSFGGRVSWGPTNIKADY